MKNDLTSTSAYSANSRTAKEMAKLPSRISPNRSVQRIRHLIIVFDSLPYELAMWVFFTSVTVMLFSWWAVAASVVWAPFGALICALIAWRRGLNPRRYAVAGAAHSVLFFLPWVYLAARMLGVRVPKPLVVLGCAVAYAAWLQGIAQYSFMHWALDDDYRMLLAWLFPHRHGNRVSGAHNARWELESETVEIVLGASPRRPFAGRAAASRVSCAVRRVSVRSRGSVRAALG